MSKQTATNWLEKEFIKIESTIGVHSKMYELLEQAKEMEKQQLIEACNQIEVIGLDHELPGEQYYNKTFKD
jgi:hypothetical protein